MFHLLLNATYISNEKPYFIKNNQQAKYKETQVNIFKYRFYNKGVKVKYWHWNHLVKSKVPPPQCPAWRQSCSPWLPWNCPWWFSGSFLSASRTRQNRGVGTHVRRVFEWSEDTGHSSTRSTRRWRVSWAESLMR